MIYGAKKAAGQQMVNNKLIPHITPIVIGSFNDPHNFCESFLSNPLKTSMLCIGSHPKKPILKDDLFIKNNI